MTKPTEGEWAERVRAWRASGVTSEAFASAGGYRSQALVWWAGELRRRAQPSVAATSKVALARVAVTRGGQGEPRDEALTVLVGSARIVVRRGFDASVLRDVVEALGAAT